MKFELFSDSIVHEDFDGEIVIIDLENGYYFSLNKPAAWIWTNLVSGLDLDAIRPAVSFENVTQVPLGDPVDDIVAKFVEEKLLKDSADAPSGNAIEGQSFSEYPTLLRFDDLSELITADPVHDVDREQGWPVQPAANP